MAIYWRGIRPPKTYLCIRISQEDLRHNRSVKRRKKDNESGRLFWSWIFGLSLPLVVEFSVEGQIVLDSKEM